MRVNRILLLPFWAARSGTDQRNRRRPQDHPANRGRAGANEAVGGNGFTKELTKHESAADFANKNEEDIVQDYNAPIHWWIISTLFPLIAGTFGPMASAFNILAVAIDWRLIIFPDSTEASGPHIPDPSWLVAVNAVSLAIAIIANLALLAQMTNRIHFKFAAPVTIVGWYVSGLVDIALVAAAPTHLPLPRDDGLATYSQAYYYACFAGAIYVILSMMLTWTAWGVFIGHFGAEFKLSISQRSLMLQTMLFLGYVLAAGAVYSTIEGWVYLDGVYFTVVTLFTIGFGDFVPKTHLGRSLFFPFAIGGILFVGLIIGSIRSLVLESASVKISTRLVEKTRYKALMSGDLKEGIVKIDGKNHPTRAPTELARRENEFDLMRKIQKKAARNNRMLTLSLATTAFCILWFIGAVVFWKAEQGPGGQDWTYFQCLYFTFVAQLTIGYGDFEPQTNSSKPAFVLWALIALPTLTVLVGAVGDAVNEFVYSSNVWMGKHAGDVARLYRTLKTSKHRLQDTTTGLQRMEKGDGDQNTSGHGFDDIAVHENGLLMPRPAHAALTPEQRTEERRRVERAYRPLVIAQASQRVLAHLDDADDDKPRRYSFAEWTWLLRLLGEDEASPAQHRWIGHALADDREIATPVRRHDHQVWSWMGQESPLMNLDDGGEPKWVLRRLLEVLERELQSRGDDEVAPRSGTPIGADGESSAEP